MLYILATVVIIGIISALIVLLKGLKDPPAVPLPEKQPSAAFVGKGPHAHPGLASKEDKSDKADTFEERSIRIEKLLNEKSREVVRLERELQE